MLNHQQWINQYAYHGIMGMYMEWGCNQQKLDMLSKNSCASAQAFMIIWVYLRVFLGEEVSTSAEPLKTRLKPRMPCVTTCAESHACAQVPLFLLGLVSGFTQFCCLFPKTLAFNSTQSASLIWLWSKIGVPMGMGMASRRPFFLLGSNSFSRWLCATQLVPVHDVSDTRKCPIPCGLIIWGKSFKGSHHSVYDWLVKSWNMSLSKTSDPKLTVFYCVKSMPGQNVSTVSNNHHRGLIVFYVKVHTPNMRVTSPGTFEFFEERQRKVDLDTVFVVVHLGTSPHLIAGTGNCVGWRVSTQGWPPGNMRFTHSRSF